MAESWYKVDSRFVDVVRVKIVDLHIDCVEAFVPQIFRFNQPSAIRLRSTV
jgi:hypothetical protein